ncbi:helix-turn-helix transcriptional regulator [Blastococcus sp. TF02A_35]|uniref:helix-turn-helix transcriptional regulator n=1 Tax=Blastococcus sp. TF02A-35 TaxID=2559612 RepID=UPI0010746835|nr:helix-turn-helix transcriptional regulator [Blastococcus sp. TF02A_35]TFV49527.1 XRE family transcriptional regulator [Blastococcus sp. TF02A_35]
MPDWETLVELLADVGKEGHLARRMVAERTRRGWSQAELARQVQAQGFRGLGQPAISAIEKPNGRRAITVDEALALSRVFEIPLPELLLPDDVLFDVRLARDIRRGVLEREEIDRQMSNYLQLLRSIVAVTRTNEPQQWEKRFEQEVARADADRHALAEDWGPNREEAEARAQFYRDLLEEHRREQGEQ